MTACPKCSAAFIPAKSWQRYCSERCRRNDARNRRRRGKRAFERKLATCDAPGCEVTFMKRNSSHHYCSTGCRDRGRWDRQMKAASVAAPGEPGYTRKLYCHRCGGRHKSADCRNRRAFVKQYGTVVDGRYVPPQGVAVRVVKIPRTVHGDTVGELLKEAKS